MKTDDSFQFARAIKRLRQAIEALGDATGTIDAIDGVSTGADGGNEEAGGGGGGGEGVISLPLERKRAVILIMKEAFKSYHLAWARSSIEPAFKVPGRGGGVIFVWPLGVKLTLFDCKQMSPAPHPRAHPPSLSTHL